MQGLIRTVLHDTGAAALLGVSSIGRTFRRPFEASLWIEQIHAVGVGSLTLTNLTLLFTGMVLAVQTAHSLAAYGGTAFVGDLLGLSVVRELGPVLTALMLAGRVGAGITAELGSMAVTEQIDAMRALAADPVRKLVVPRVGALVVAAPMLTILADAVGIFGGLVLAVTEVGQTRAYYMSHVLRALDVQDVFSGLGKSMFFGFFIGVIACRNGLSATGGADGVGRAVTETVVSASIAVIVSDFILTKLFLLL